MQRLILTLLWYIVYRTASVVAILAAAVGLIAKSGVVLAIGCFLAAFAPWIDSGGYPEGIADEDPEEF